MLNSWVFYAGVIACLVTVIVLMLGIGAFARGGAFNRKHSNRLMRYRIIAQAVAVLLIVVFSYLRSLGGN